MSTLPRILEAVHRSLVGKCPRRSELILSTQRRHQQMRGAVCSSAVASQERDVELCSATYFAPLNLFPNFGAKLDRVPTGPASDVLFL